jgi:hypothetical protein
MMSLIFTMALMAALALTPWLLARQVAPRASQTLTLALWGPALVTVNSLVPLGLHLSGVPISRLPLASAHLALVGGLAGLALIRRLPLIPQSGERPLRLVFPLIALLIISLPVTRIAGIDTYKWQDLATNVQIEQTIPWLIHPISLFGFTPRSYPSAQPLVLATIQILGGTGVDWGFYVLSALTGAMGLLGAYALGCRLFNADKPAFWFAVLYSFSPVFLRYTYWSTGRGLLMGLLPLFLLALLSLPRLAAIGGLFVMLPLLGLAHKAGLVAAVMIPVCFALSPIVGRLRTKWTPVILLIPSLAVSLLIGGTGISSLLFRPLSRLALLIPLSFAGWIGAALLPRVVRSTDSGWMERHSSRAMLVGGLATLPLVFANDMYGTLLALPFIAFSGTVGLQWIVACTPTARVPFLLAATAVLTFGPALMIVAHQAKDSPSESVYEAACFLERHDPYGPYRIEAPGRARTQMQAYVSGCPRFSVSRTDNSRLRTHSPPPCTGNRRRDLDNWVHYLRGILDLTESNVDWYGGAERIYHITIGGEGSVPAGEALLFTSGNVAVFGPSPK